MAEGPSAKKSRTSSELSTLSDEDRQYFMAVAKLTARRSVEPVKVGACIVNEDKEIVGIGYNEFPFVSSHHKSSWGKKYIFILHAAANAVCNKIVPNLKNCTLFTTMFPCDECAKVIVQSGIKEVLYSSDEDIKGRYCISESKKLLDTFKINHEQFQGGAIIHNVLKRIEDQSDSGENLGLDNYFMAIAGFTCKNPNTQVGACIVNEDNQIVGLSYKRQCDVKTDTDMSPVHAELYAMLTALTTNLAGCRLYMTSVPCTGCAKVIIKSRIAVVHLVTGGEIDSECSLKMLEAVGVKLIKWLMPNRLSGAMKKSD